MATLLYAWELGGGLGHVSQLVPLVSAMRSARHRVHVALRDLSRPAELLGGSEVKLLQAPYNRPARPIAVTTPRTFAHVLWNAGYGDPAELQALSDAWGRLFDSVNPDLIVFDYAPTALLAARGRKVKRAVLGNGFFCPPDHAPQEDLRPWLPPDPAALLEDERRVLENMNRVLARRGVEPLKRVTQLYGEVDDTFLTTLAEMDHYSRRQSSLTPGFQLPSPCQSAFTPGLSDESGAERQVLTPCPSPVLPSMAGGRGETEATGPSPIPDPSYLISHPSSLIHHPSLPAPRYRGPWSMPGGVQPVWPPGSGKRVYAYLKPSPSLPKILKALRLSGCPTIVFGSFDRATQARFAAANIRFEVRLLELRRVAEECDAAVLNAGHATTLEFLLAGVPILQSPIFLEQAITARNTVRMGAGLVASLPSAERTAEQLSELLTNPRYTEAARRLAARYASFSAESEIALAVQRLNEFVDLASTSAAQNDQTWHHEETPAGENEANRDRAQYARGKPNQ